MISISIITAPRNRQTLKTSVNSLRRSGFEGNITIFAEPETKYIPLDGTYWLFNGKNYGCFKNYTQALHWLVDNSELPYVGVFSDDFTYSRMAYRDACRYISNANEFGSLALYTPTGMKPIVHKKGANIINEGWGVTWGGNYIFKKEVAKQLLEHPLYVDHYNNYEKNQQIDHLIPKVLKELKLDQLFINPSLCDHIGFNSTIGHTHTHREKGLNFRS